MNQPIPSVEVQDHGDHATIYPQGYLNGPTGEQLDAICADLVSKGHRRIIINFAHTETMNTMGIANLVSILEKVGRRQGTVCFCNLLPTNQQMLDMLEISRAVLIFEDENQALNHLQTRQAS